MPLTRPRSWQLLDSDYKDSVRVATTTNVTLNAAPNTVDGVTLVKRDRILVKSQNTASQNGIYYVQTLGTGANGVWVRAADFSSTESISSGVQVLVEEGTTNGDRTFQLSTNNPIVLDSTDLTFTPVSGGLDTVTSIGNTTTNGIGVGSLAVDNISIDVNTISSTNTNGNINLTPNGTGQVVSSGIVNATRFVSNIATGTAPFTVTSTTQVANLNVATAGTAGTVTTNAQPNITSVGTLSSLTTTGDVSAGNRLMSTSSSGDEGGEILLNVPQTNTTIAGTGITIDVYQNKLRIFEQGGSARGAYIDITSAGAGVSSNLLSSSTPSRIANGTSNVEIVSSAGNVTIGVGGTANAVTFTTTAVIANSFQSTSNGTGQNFKVGDDAYIGDVDQANTLNIRGQQNAANGYVVFGNADNTAQLGRAGSGPLTYAGSFEANGTISGTRFISNIATGTAPFTVTSTTQVANLNVATAGSATTAGTVTTAAQPNITSVGNLTIANIDNITIDGNTISSTNTNGNIDISPNGTGNINLNDPVQVTSTVQATRFISNIATGTAPFTVTSTTQVANLNVATAGTAGTVTTNAQPNITSVGTLTGLTLSGDVTLNAQSDLRFADSDSSNWIALQAPGTIASNVTLTLPATDGSNGNALLTYGNGVLYWGTAGGSGITFTASATAPGSPVAGAEWWDTDDGTFWKYINDGTTSQWVEWGPNNSLNGQELITGNLIPNANVTYNLGNTTARLNNIWANVVTGTTFTGTTFTGTTLTGTLTTAAQPNITSVGNLTIANVANIQIDANTISTTNTNGNLTLSPNGTGSIVVTKTILPNANATLSLGSTSLRFANIWGLSSSAQYADLAEKFLADKNYPIGTVLMIGGDAEVTEATKDSRAIVGTVSEKPGFIMNDALEGEHVVSIAYIGRVPCRVEGQIKRGDLLVVGNTSGVATAAININDVTGKLIGKALQDNESGFATIEILVGRL